MVINPVVLVSPTLKTRGEIRSLVDSTGIRIIQRSNPEADASQLEQLLTSELKVSQITARILVNRGVSSVDEARIFLSPSLRDGLSDPSLVLNMDTAAERIAHAVSSGTQITIFSDFDVDGVTSGSQLLLFLRSVGSSANIYTPNRFTEGYGLSKHAIDKLCELGTELLITVDCGISNTAEIAYAKKRGLGVIVIDHHEPHTIPPADVVVDPAQPGCPFQQYKLCAAGLVWMLLIRLRSHLRQSKKDSANIPDPKEFLDLAALGTICDMVPLTKVNRVIAHRGLETLRSSKRPGIVALKQVAGTPLNHRFNAGHVGFGLGPRINAAGRLSDATEAVELLTTTDSNRAASLARKLDSLNASRQAIEQQIKHQCIEMITSNPAMLEQAALALYEPKFHAGVIGIVAQRLVELFSRPTAVMALGETTKGGKTQQVIKGSVRSVQGFHVAQALEQLSEFLLTHGGHAEAGGFSLLPERLAEFRSGFATLANQTLTAEQRQRSVGIDCEVRFKDLDFEVVSELERLAPFGMGNPAPVFFTGDVVVDSVTLLGEQHIKLRLLHEGSTLTALGWNMRGHTLLKKGNRLQIAYSTEINSYQGVSSVQLSLKEVWQ